MLNSEFSAENIHLHQCEVRRVYPSGLLDVKSLRGPSFERVAPLASTSSYTVGTQCMLLTDGAQKIVLGPFREPDGGTIHPRTEEFVDWNEAEMLHVEDRYGTRATVVAAKGIGVWVETGDFCSTHWSPATNQIARFCERLDVYMPAHRQELWHDGNKAGARYRWRTRPDDDMLDGELQGDVQASSDRGLELNIHIEERDDAVQITVEDGGQEKLSVTYSRDETFKIVCQDVATEGKTVTVAADDKVSVATDRMRVDSDDIELGEGEPGHELDAVTVNDKVKTEIQTNRTRINAIEQAFSKHVHGFAGPGGLTSPPPPSIPPNIDPDTFTLDDIPEPDEPNPLGDVPGMGSSNVKAKK